MSDTLCTFLYLRYIAVYQIQCVCVPPGILRYVKYTVCESVPAGMLLYIRYTVCVCLYLPVYCGLKDKQFVCVCL